MYIYVNIGCGKLLHHLQSPVTCSTRHVQYFTASQWNCCTLWKSRINNARSSKMPCKCLKPQIQIQIFILIWFANICRFPDYAIGWLIFVDAVRDEWVIQIYCRFLIAYLYLYLCLCMSSCTVTDHTSSNHSTAKQVYQALASYGMLTLVKPWRLCESNILVQGMEGQVFPLFTKGCLLQWKVRPIFYLYLL